MSDDLKLKSPITIHLGKKLIMPDEYCDEVYPLNPGALIDGNHYGFVLISEKNGHQKETIFYTQCRIVGICMNSNKLLIFEEGKKRCWTFNNKGDIIYSAQNEEYDNINNNFVAVAENFDQIEYAILNNPIHIRIPLEHWEDIIVLKDELIKEDYPCYPGVILGTEHYGFIITAVTEDGERDIVYPTTNRIDAVCMAGEYRDAANNNIQIMEQGKYHPWMFTCDGELIQKASYNPYSRRDIQYFNEKYNVLDAKDRIIKINSKIK